MKTIKTKMSWIRFLSMLLIAVFLIGLLIGCEKKTESELPTQTPNTDDDTANEAESQLYYYAGNFSEGKAFVSTKAGYTEYGTVCIDRDGNTLFTIPSSGYAISDFKNGVAAVVIKRQVCLINGEGTIVVSPDTHGYTNAAFRNTGITTEKLVGECNWLLENNYFPVRSYENGKSGAKCKVGVLDCAGNWVLPLSDTYLAEYCKNEDDNLSEYGWGASSRSEPASDDVKNLICFNRNVTEPVWFHMETGEVFSYESRIDNSCLYVTSYSECRYSSYDLSKVLSLQTLYSDVIKCYSFTGELAAVVFGDWDTGGCKIGLIDREGNLLFEPFSVGEVESVGIDETMFWVSDETGCYYYDHSGQAVLRQTNADFGLGDGNKWFCSGFSDGLAVVRIAKNSTDKKIREKDIYFYIDETGARVIG